MGGGRPHLVIGVDVGGPEVDDNVHDEHDVHDEVHHVERGAGVAARLHGRLLLVARIPPRECSLVLVQIHVLLLLWLETLIISIQSTGVIIMSAPPPPLPQSKHHK